MLRESKDWLGVFPSDASTHAAMVEELRRAGLKAEAELRELRGRQGALEAENVRLRQQQGALEAEDVRLRQQQEPLQGPASSGDGVGSLRRRVLQVQEDGVDEPPPTQAAESRAGGKRTTGPSGAGVSSTSRSSRPGREAWRGERDARGGAVATEVSVRAAARQGPRG